MKILKTAAYNKIADKYPKSETTPYNPWRICNKSTGGKKESPEAFERCVKHLKEQNKSKNKKKKSQFEGQIYTPEVENQFSQQHSNLYKKRKELGFDPLKKRGPSKQNTRRGLEKTPPNMSDLEWKRWLQQKLKATEPEPVFAQKK